MNNLRKYRNLNVSTSGVKSNYKLLEPGVSNIDDGQGGDTYKLERNVKIHLHMVDLEVSGAAEITLKIGTQEVFKHGVDAADYIHFDAVDRTGDPIKDLNISVDQNVDVSGVLIISIEPYGSRPVTGIAVNQSVDGS